MWLRREPRWLPVPAGGRPMRGERSEAKFCFASDPILREAFPSDPLPQGPPPSLSAVAHCPELCHLPCKFRLPLLEGLSVMSQGLLRGGT